MGRKKKIKEVQPDSTEEVQLDPKAKAIKLALGAIEKAYGKGSATQGAINIPGLQWLNSGCLSLNKALSGSYDKGYPRGRIIEVLGPESSGKSTLCLHAVAEAQKAGETTAYVDIEHALDPSYAEALDIDMEELIISQPSCGEDALNIVEALVSSGAVALIIVDSVAALVPRAEIEGSIGDAHMGLQARLMSQAMRMLAGKCQRTGTTIIFINQIRMKLISWGNPEVGAGGQALKFYASQRLDIRRIGGVKDGAGDYIANETRVKLVKSKVSRPFRQTEFKIEYGEGIDILDDLLEIAVKHDIIDKKGSWYTYIGDNIGQGAANTTAWLKQNPEVIEKIKKQLGELP